MMPSVITEFTGRFRGIDEWHLISPGRRKKFIRGCDKKIRKRKRKINPKEKNSETLLCKKPKNL